MLLIFDCDGVLVDSELIALEELSAILAENGYAMDVAACGEAFLGRHVGDILAGIETRLGRPLPGGAPGMARRMLTRLERELKPVPGVAALLDRLDGPRCVASSSDRARIAATLRWTGLDSFFGSHIFSGLEVARGKPAPDLFLHAAAQMGVPPAACVVIEDSVFGVAAGVAAGMPVLGFTGGSHSDAGHAARLLSAGAQRVVARMDDVPAALVGLSSG